MFAAKCRWLSPDCNKYHHDKYIKIKNETQQYGLDFILFDGGTLGRGKEKDILHQAKHVTYQNGGDDKGAVSQGISDVHPFSLRHFCDVKTSWRTPLPHLWKIKTV